MAILAILPVLFLVPAVLNRRRYLPDQQAEINIRAARERLLELQGGVADDKSKDDDEIHAALLEELKHTDTVEPRTGSPYPGLTVLGLSLIHI